ncbi:MAG TPA: HAMP domain-containing sensor histidine kinase [Nocardioides sp.]|uniref:sensor histidine kinase n=1 Tax=Nocardioides sp. TaxID=35761 RepID=UPI002D7EEDDE|nr:HAMP domain-containing sensor histidine kinase [Nocardioides sp.]HET6654219.1 HAMP domain-containing sensor histidine kinase [Nocardioides sp.]
MTTGATTTETTTADAVTTARTTTEPSAHAGGLSGISVRTRLITVVALLTGLALAAAGGLVYALESARIEDQVRAQVEQEVEEFRNLQQGLDPDTGRPFTSVATLIELFLRRNVPDDNEALVGFWDGRARVSSESPHAPYTTSAQLTRVVTARLENGGTERLDSSFGDVVVTVVPVSNAETAGALVVLNFMQDAYGELYQVLRTYFIVSALLLLIVTGVAAWQAGRLLAPLRTLRETAQEISETDLSRRITETGNDDITALTRTVNAMLERLERAFTGQRQFLDDAGHELKTPLTVLQGHLELMDTSDATEVDATRELLLDEVDRMSRLVNELIMLAKTDRPDFFQFEPVDLAPYLDTVLEKCRALGPREWVLDEAVAQTAVIDQQRITQALLQLAQNAVKHTDAGDEIGLGARVDPDRELRLWVRDTGPGVADDAKTQIFDRFSRDRVRDDDEGFGLGLSIVAAIARAHGGTARVDDAPGGGAVFTLVLPLSRKDDTWPAS